MENNLNSNYTITFHEFYNDNIDWIRTNLVMSSEERTNKFLKQLVAVWGVYDIAGETIGEFKTFIKDEFDTQLPYFEEMLDAYEREIDYLDGLKTITKGTTHNEGITVDLPNKVVGDSVYDYPDSGNKDDGNSTIERTDNSRAITLKVRYMQQIRDLYREFAFRFKHCFIHIF